jgi:hypothetical protein
MLRQLGHRCQDILFLLSEIRADVPCVIEGVSLEVQSKHPYEQAKLDHQEVVLPENVRSQTKCVIPQSHTGAVDDLGV